MKRLLVLLPLLITSCSNRIARYDNVSYEYDTNRCVYSVDIETKTYEIGLEKVYNIFINEYPVTNDGSGHLALNSFYIKSEYDYWLVFYKLNKWH